MMSELEVQDFSNALFYEGIKECLTADSEPFAVIQVPADSPPSAIDVRGNERLIKKIREIYRQGDQKYLFVVRGTLGKLKKSGAKLTVTFEGGTEIKVPAAKKCSELADGWLGS